MGGKPSFCPLYSLGRQRRNCVNSLGACSRSGLGFPRYWTPKTQLNDALIEFYAGEVFGD